MADGCGGARRNRRPARSVRIAAARSLPRCKGHRYASLAIRRIVLSSGRSRYGGVPLIRYRNVCEFRDRIKRHRNIGKSCVKVRMRIQCSASPTHEAKTPNRFFKCFPHLFATRTETDGKNAQQGPALRSIDMWRFPMMRRKIFNARTLHFSANSGFRASAAHKKGPDFRRGPIDITTNPIERSERDAPAVDVTGIGV